MLSSLSVLAALAASAAELNVENGQLESRMVSRSRRHHLKHHRHHFNWRFGLSVPQGVGKVVAGAC
jgi:hypothetical protein